jgi:hypothetical protein
MTGFSVVRSHLTGASGFEIAVVLAAVCLILPAALDIAPALVPLGAVGLVLLMAGAIITRLRRHEARHDSA